MAERRFFCRSCGWGVHALGVPDGWLRVQQHSDAQEHRDGRTFLTLGLYCSVACLAAEAAAWAAGTTVTAG